MTRSKLPGWVLALVMLFPAAIITTTVSDVAMAQKKKPKWKLQKEATAAYKGAKKKMDAGDYPGALGLFQKADELWPGAAPKYNIAVCYDKLGRAEEAVAAYRAFIDSKPGTKYADRVIAAGKRIAELEVTLQGTVVLAIAPANVQGLSVTIDGSPATGTEHKLKPGPHTIEVGAPGYDTITQDVDIKGGQQMDLPITLQKSAVVDPDPVDTGGDTDTAGILRIAGFASLGVAVVGGALTTAFGVMALGAESDFNENPSEELADDTENNAVLSDVFLGVTGAFGIAAIALLAVGYTMDDEDSGDSAVTVTPMVGVDGGAVSVQVDF